MECGYPHSGVRIILSHPLLHLGGGLIGKGDCEDVIGVYAVFYQIADPPGNDPGLAASGPGQYLQWAFEVGDGLALWLGYVVKDSAEDFLCHSIKARIINRGLKAQEFKGLMLKASRFLC